MSVLRTSKVVAYLSVIFIAGGAAGTVITLKNARAREARAASVENACSRIQDRLKAKLDLTDDQMKRLQPVFEQTAFELQTVCSQAIRNTDTILCRAHQQIAKELTGAQKEKLDQFEKERRDSIQRRLNVPAAKE